MLYIPSPLLLACLSTERNWLVGAPNQQSLLLLRLLITDSRAGHRQIQGSIAGKIMQAMM
jgi:hypothetical protein